MKANRIPRRERLLAHLFKLRERKELNHIPSPSKGNPYWRCKECGIHDPQLSINDGKHFGNCSMRGIDKEIEHIKKLLEEEK